MLCDICQALELQPEDFLIDSSTSAVGKDYSEYQAFGTLAEVHQRSKSCALCSFFISTLEITDDVFDQFDSAQKAAQCSVHWQEDGFLDFSDETCVRVLNFRASPPLPQAPEQHRICLHADCASPEAGNTFLGRSRPQRIKRKTIQCWLKSCQRWHGQSCDLAFSCDDSLSNYNLQRNTNPTNSLRVIDCWNLCLADIDGSPNTYFALSYVWGTQPVLMLSSGSLIELQKSRALWQRWDHIPRTIQDAIRLTSTLGRRYLWVDSLCIQQDNTEDKLAIISKMHEIYDRAFLTIVAVDGTHADAGLAGLRPGSRPEQSMIRLNDNLQLCSINHLADYLQNCHYDTRAWTFQERRISRRSLLFCRDQIFFQCNAAVWREDVFLELFEASQYIDKTGYHANSGLKDINASFLELYVGCLYRYADRNLTDQYDVVDAFSAILNVLTMSQEDFATVATLPVSICGLPLLHFDWALLWKNIDGHDPQRRHPDFPSWSWCAWKHPVGSQETHLDRATLIDFRHSNTWVVWFLHGRSRIDGGYHVIHISYNQNKSENQLFPSQKFPPLELGTTTTLDSAIGHEICRTLVGAILHFKTLTIDLLLFQQSSTRNKHFFAIGDEPSHPLGYISIPKAVRLLSTSSKYRFVAISSASITVLKYYQSDIPGLRQGEGMYHVVMCKVPVSGDDPIERIEIGVMFQNAMNEHIDAVWTEVRLR